MAGLVLVTSRCHRYSRRLILKRRTIMVEQTCEHCTGEIDRFGDGPWFHVDTMMRWCPAAMFATPATVKRTDELVPGDRVRIGIKRVRTVRNVADSGYVTANGCPILNVWYVEQSTHEWGHGNSSCAEAPWTLAG